jgi:hypothetical protein
MNSERLSELRAVAEKASTQQRWKLYNDGSICANVNGGQHSIAKITFPKLKGSMEDARHIAAFDPTTCLELLEEVERLTALIDKSQTCVVCEATLCEPETPPHCEDCILREEHYGDAD